MNTNSVFDDTGGPLGAVSSDRIIYTPSNFARSALIHLQETGTLQALFAHTSKREGLNSFLFFVVISGEGSLSYDGAEYKLKSGDCVFIDCRKPYSHSTSDNLWSLGWVHFFGPNMNAVYSKFRQRGGKPVFSSSQLNNYRQVLDELYHIAASADYVRDMRIHEKLSSLLVLLMEDAWDESNLVKSETVSGVDIQQIKDYLDNNFFMRITIDELAAKFFINKYYLMKLFKERYGFTVNAYLNSLRVTYVKEQLRFNDKTIEQLSDELKIEPAYLSRLFKKLEGLSPSAYRKIWRGR